MGHLAIGKLHSWLSGWVLSTSIALNRFFTLDQSPFGRWGTLAFNRRKRSRRTSGAGSL